MREQLHFEESLGVVICHLCEAGVEVNSANSINNHFRAPPHHLKGAALKAVHEQFQQWPIRRPAEVEYPEAGDQPIRAIPHLQSCAGWHCQHCDRWVCTDLANTKTHLRQVHGVRRGQEDRDLKRCCVQTIFRQKRLIRWFRVEGDQGVPPRRKTGFDAQSHDVEAFVSSQISLLRQIDSAERAEVERVRAFDDHKSSVIPWVRSCGFDRHLKGLDTKEVRRSYRRLDQREPDQALVQKVAAVSEQLLDETWRWCVDGPQCRLTRPMAVVLSQFWTEATIHARGFRIGIGTGTKVRYFGL
jgi:hypothetical protein